MKRHQIVLLVATAAMAVASLPAFAAGGKTTSAIWVDTGTFRTDGVLNYKDSMNFGYRTTAQYPTIQLQCFQNRVLVFASSHAAYPGGYGYDQPFQLGPSYAWAGGAAKCTGTLGYRASTGRYVTLATTSFDVAA